MSLRLVARAIVALALLAPITLVAQTFKTAPTVTTNVSITLNPAGLQPARLHYASATQTFDVQAESAKVTYIATGMTVEMTMGDYAAVSTSGNFEHRNKDSFKTLHLTFATNGDMISFRVVKE